MLAVERRGVKRSKDRVSQMGDMNRQHKVNFKGFPCSPAEQITRIKFPAYLCGHAGTNLLSVRKV
jgi:hypothetical protein